MRILIVEDEPDTLSEIETCLKRYDGTLEIESCENPLLAIKAFQSNSFDAVLLDIQMPEMTGLELAECLSAMSPKIHIVFITAFNHYGAEAFDLNAVDYVLKPIRQERFNKALDKIKKEIEEMKKASVPEGGVTIRVLGKLVVSKGNHILRWKRRKSPEIFAFLLHHLGTPVHKETLCETMWPEYDPQKALAYLQTIMYQLRKNLAELDENCITIEYADHCYRLSLAGVRYDADLFSQAFAQAYRVTIPSIDALVNAEQLYTGAYLGEEGWIWALGKQQSLSRKYQKVLESLMIQHIRIGNKEEAMHYILKWTSLDTYKDRDYYLSWVEDNIGAETAKKLKAAFSDED